MTSVSFTFRRIAIMLVLIWLSYMLSFFHRFAPSGIATQLAEAFQTPATALGILAGGYFYVYTLMQIPTGVILDMWGPKLLLLWGGILAGLGSVAFGLAPSLPWALVARIVVGLGVSVTFLAMLKVYALAFPEHRFSTMVGVGLLMGNLGSILAGYPLSALSLLVDWQTIFFGLGIFSFLIGIACWWAIPDFPSVQFTGTQANAKVTLMERITHAKNGLLDVVKNIRSWPPTIVNGGIAGCLFAFGGLWITPWLKEVHQISQPNAGWLVSIYFFGFAMGSLVIGRWSDHIRHRTLPMRSMAILHALFFAWWMVGATLSFEVMAVLLFAMGIVTSSFTLTWASIKEINPPALSGTSTSFANMAGFLLGGILQALIGKVLDSQSEWYQAFGRTLDTSNAAEVFRLPIGLLFLCAMGAVVASFFVTETNAKNLAKS